MYSIVLTTSPDRSSRITTFNVFATASNANDSANELGASVGALGGDISGLVFGMMGGMPRITGSSRCAGVFVMGGRCDMAFSVSVNT